MVRFFLKFIVIQFTLFFLYVTDVVQHYAVVPFTAKIASLSAWLIMFFDKDVISEGVVIRDLGRR